MPSHRHSHRSPHLENRSPLPNARPSPLPVNRLDLLGPRHEPHLILERAASTSSAVARHSCGPDDNSSFCEKPTDSSSITLPVVLGSVIPITIAIVVLLILHRRHVKKLRLEDKNDKHKSLDFGMDEVKPKPVGRSSPFRRSKIPPPEVSITDTEKTLRRGRGMSLDLGMDNPYLLPPGLQNSRESLHSLSRSAPGDDDPYRPVTSYIPNDDTRSSSPSMRRALDDTSSYTASSSRYQMQQDEMSRNLLQNAQRMSRSNPPSPTLPSVSVSPPEIKEPDQAHIVDRKNLPKKPENKQSPSLEPSQQSNNDGLRDSNMYLSKFINSREPSPDRSTQSKDSPSDPAQVAPEKTVEPPLSSSPPVRDALPSNPRPNRQQSLDKPFLPMLPDIEKNDFTIHEVELSPREDGVQQDANHSLSSTNLNPAHESGDLLAERPVSGRYSLDASSQYNYNEYAEEHQDYLDYQTNLNRRTMLSVPLPPEDPNDTPEERATRIKSFYKEYFDNSKPGQTDYYEDYDNYYQNDYYGPMYDEARGQFAAGRSHFYEEPITRRAMTPPPRGPPRARGMPGHMSGGSMGFHPGARAYSSASFQNGPGRRMPPKKNLPPPGPLQTLPTPHLLKDDTFLPIDFAPPSSIRDRVAGRPESPLGIKKPYSPTTAAHVPLASSFEDLSAVPSPHALRKSGTFTNLDFAPPPRFKNSDSGSDAGSVRSGRSNRSALQVQNIRAGAYRLSRIPKEVAGTKDELADSLRPTWGMGR